MNTTVAILGIFLLLIVVCLEVWGFFLWVGLRWAKAEGVTLRRILTAALLTQVVLPLLMAPMILLVPSSQAAIVTAEVLKLAIGIVVPYLFIKWIFGMRRMQAFKAWLPTLLASVIAFALASVIVEAQLFQAFTSPSNGMAPTLLGNHLQGVCPQCGATCYASPGRFANPIAVVANTICDHFHVATDQELDEAVHPHDQFIICKFLEPQRWDIVVFAPPEDPTTQYVQRLAGLPGEEIVIEGGKIFANGAELKVPDDLAGITYASEMPPYPDALWGTRQKPAQLGADEYFMLGDFSVQSKDSRMWEQGAEGHPPYAVPKSHIVGVVTHIYWPLSRSRVFR